MLLRLRRRPIRMASISRGIKSVWNILYRFLSELLKRYNFRQGKTCQFVLELYDSLLNFSPDYVKLHQVLVSLSLLYHCIIALLVKNLVLYYLVKKVNKGKKNSISIQVYFEFLAYLHGIYLFLTYYSIEFQQYILVSCATNTVDDLFEGLQRVL